MSEKTIGKKTGFDFLYDFTRAAKIACPSKFTCELTIYLMKLVIGTNKT